MTARRSFHLALALAAATFFVLWFTAPSVGVVRDESYYFKAAEEYGAWWGDVFSSRFVDAFKDATIQQRFSYNTEHPALIKLIQSITYRIFHAWTNITGPTQAFRATGFLFAALSLLATFLLGRMLFSDRVGLVAAVLLLAIPRYFYDAHLACFDVPMAAIWTISLWAFGRAYFLGDGVCRRRDLWIAGSCFGIALATKLNALFLPVVFVSVWLLDRSRAKRVTLVPGPSGSRDFVLPPIPKVLVWCAVVGPIVFYMLWPHLWHDPIGRIDAYLSFHRKHEHYPIAYFHRLWVRPPFPVSFPFVMSALTLPAPVLILGALGLGRAMWRTLRHGDGKAALLAAATLLPILLIALPSTPIFGGVKHWYNAMPTLVILAAEPILQGLDAVVAKLRAMHLPRLGRATGVGIMVLAVLPGALGIVASHPYGIAYYNEFAGGISGAARLGMQRGFWGGLGDELFVHFERLGLGSTVFFNRSTYDAWRMHQREGRISNRVYYANDAKNNVAGAIHFEQPEHGEREGEVWSALGTRPVDGVYLDGVTLTQVYIRGESDRPPKEQ